MNLFRLLGIVAALTCGIASALAQTFQVTAPTNGSFIGLSNQVRFTINGATAENLVRVTAVGPGNVTFTNDGRFTPDANGQISSSVALNFSQGVPEGAYTITATATQAGNTYATVVINVTLDVTKPKFLQFNPIGGSFVRGIVPIRVDVLEPNFKDYRVQVDGQDIPDGTGTVLTNNAFTVMWDTTNIEFDGSKTISIRLRDEADNEENRSFEVTLDRVAPSVTIVQPRVGIRLPARSHVSVAVDVLDASSNSTHISGVDVIAKTLAGATLGRVSVTAFFNASGGTNRWTGRLRYRTGIPKKFKLVVNVIDKAGNVAATQEVIVEYR